MGLKVIENHSPLKKSRGFKLINQVMNINLENTRIMSKIMEKLINTLSFFNLHIS